MGKGDHLGENNCDSCDLADPKHKHFYYGDIVVPYCTKRKQWCWERNGCEFYKRKVDDK